MSSPTIFLKIIDWIIREKIVDNNMDIQWTKQLEDLDLADDVDLLYCKLK
jgi:hypothetical protein